MRRRTSAAPAQVVLSLQREQSDLPIASDSAALLRALADLLLGALGANVEEASDTTPIAEGGADEPEGHP